MPSSQPEPSCRAVDLCDPSLYINRETAWLQFNGRVLEEALNADNPLLERVKFLSIFATNLDEFFMIRVSGLSRQVTGGVLEAPPDGMTPLEQLAGIRKTLLGHLERALNCWHQDLSPKLRQSGISILGMSDLGHHQKAWLRRYFAREIFPALTPLAFDPAHPFPHISNLSFNLAVVVSDPQAGERFARVKISDVAPSLVRLPDETDLEADPEIGGEVKANNFVSVEEVVAANLDMLFPGIDVVAAYPFRITRDADLEIKDDEASDLLTSVEAQIEMRHWGSVVRLEIDRNMPERIRDVLTRNLELEPFQVYTLDGPLNLAGLMELAGVERPDLKDRPYLPVVAPQLARRERLFDTIRRQDVLLYHPYDSFVPVVDFIREAASDPDVLAIKQTLYRVGPNSPIVAALMEARENQKQVAVLLELKARFDEENNIAWARALEDEGVHVIYGVLGVKTHAKMCLVVRREADGIRCYVHMGTGNYNPVTSRIYTDLSYFTCNPDISADVSDLFNALTGYSDKGTYRRLLVAPRTMRQQIIARIEREIARHQEHGDGYIAFKMNALVDTGCIQALYRASQAGVTIDLQVRGICCLSPGVPGVSETISVTSIVGRYLEHARIYFFRNGGDSEVFLGSADLMPRNLDRRVEVLFPVVPSRLRDTILRDILGVHLQDTVQSRRLLTNGQYEPFGGAPETDPLNSQEWLMHHWRGRGAAREG